MVDNSFKNRFMVDSRPSMVDFHNGTLVQWQTIPKDSRMVDSFNDDSKMVDSFNDDSGMVEMIVEWQTPFVDFRLVDSFNDRLCLKNA